MKPEAAVHKALCEDNADLLRETLSRHPELKARVNEPLGPFDSPLINSVRSRAMLDVFLKAGADINARSRWWAGGFGLLDSANDDVAAYAISKGAVVDVHAAARLGLMDRIRELIAKDPGLVHARGGDGQTPLHFARNIEVAQFLLEHGADINARDVDHESTPVQYMIAERQDVARFLISRGAESDLLAAAALGDLELAKAHLDRDPEAVRLRVTDRFFPMKDRRAGGTIYQWTLGFHVSPHQVARKFNHEEVYAFLMERSPAEVQLVNACWVHDAGRVRRLLADNPGIASRLGDAETEQLAHAARNNDSSAVRLMLEAGFPVNVRGQHRATPLHWACWHGNAEMAALLLDKGASIHDADNEFNGTPMNWAIHGAENGWHKETGDYPAVKGVLETWAKRPHP